MDEVKCPQCGTMVFNLQDVDSSLIEMLAAKGKVIPDAICSSCIAENNAIVGKGGLLYAREKQKEQNRLALWKGRVELIKGARSAMGQKMFAEAVVMYEKYIRVLEVVFQVESGGLRPEIFNQTTHVKELTVITSVYWDLMRIYDTSDQYNQRQKEAAEKLATFVRFTPIYPDIIRKAQLFEKSAKNKSAFSNFLKMSNAARPRCFIATAAFEYPQAPEIIELRSFRDQVLKKSAIGRKFILIYYKFSPRIANFLDAYSFLKYPTRKVLQGIVKIIKN